MQAVGMTTLSTSGATTFNSLVVSTTPVSTIRAGVERLLGALPLVPARRIAVMTGLALGFIPRLLREAGLLPSLPWI